jgi:trans-aconitate methyltransferase
VSGIFAGWTAEHYRHFRRDVPDAVVDELVGRLGLDAGDTAVELGAGTGQVARRIPVAG